MIPPPRDSFDALPRRRPERRLVVKPLVASTRLGALAVAIVALGMPGRSIAAGTTQAAMPAAARATLQSYLSAVAAARYDAAFALLTTDGRRYFESGANYASIFETDRLKLERSKIGSATSTARGIVANVRETTQYFDPASQTTQESDGNVLYGLIKEGAAYRIKDPFHPWRGVAVDGAGTVVDGVTATVRKVWFFSGRIEMIVTFENRGAEAVTILPNRTIVRDDTGAVLHCLSDPSLPYTDRQIRLGLRLASNSRYTGALAFASAVRYRPHSLQLTVGPMLRDGADAPFSIDLASVIIAH